MIYSSLWIINIWYMKSSMTREQLENTLSAKDFSSSTPNRSIPILTSIYESAQSGGLFELKDLAGLSSDPILKSLLLDIFNGISPGELLALSLEKIVCLKTAEQRGRTLFLTYFAMMLHQANSPDPEQSLRDFLDSPHKLSTLLKAGLKPTLPDRDSLSSNISSEEELLQYFEEVKDYQGTLADEHPFTDAFLDFIDCDEADRLGLIGLIGVLRFGIVSKQDMNKSYRYLLKSYQKGRTGPFAVFLLSMHYLYNREELPYEPSMALKLMEKSAAAGNTTAAEYLLKTYQDNMPPTFPYGDEPGQSSIPLSDDEIDSLMKPSTGTKETDFKNPKKANKIIKSMPLGWNGSLQFRQAVFYMGKSEIEKGWKCLSRSALVGNIDALTAIVSVWVNQQEFSLTRNSDDFDKLRKLVIIDRSSQVFLLLAASCQESYILVKMFIESAPSEYQSLKNLLIKEREAEDQRQRESGGLPSEIMDRLLDAL